MLFELRQCNGIYFTEEKLFPIFREISKESENFNKQVKILIDKKLLIKIY